MRRLLPLLAAVLGVLALPSVAAAADVPAQPDDPIVFPVVGKVSWTDTFGAPRSGGRTHEGQDLLGTKMQQLVAAAAGTITFLRTDGAQSGNMLELTADDGWVYSYLHLNNDTPGTDDGRADLADVFGPGIVVGARVAAGQLVGYVGDSGNAESSPPHVHFEVRTPQGTTVNPAAALGSARHVEASGAGDPGIPRLAGPDRITTAVAVSREGWSSGADDVVLVTGDRYEEALPASVLAAQRGGPMLLTMGATLPPAVQSELTRLNPKRVTVVGSVAPSVDAALAAPGRTITRVGVAGDPVATAVAVASVVGGASGTAVLVNQARFADGVSATAIAAGRGWPVLLTTTDIVPQRTVDAWRALGVRRLVLVGGTAVLAAKIENFARTAGRCAGGPGCVVERLAGPDRYATSVAVAVRSLALGGRSPSTVLLGTGTAFPDVLASGPLASKVGGVSLLVDGSGSGADSASRSFLAALAEDVEDVAILGGTGAVTLAAARTLAAALGR